MLHFSLHLLNESMLLLLLLPRPSLSLQASDVAYEGPTSLATVKQPETAYSRVLKELHDR